jgi:hypothetical protein
VSRRINRKRCAMEALSPSLQRASYRHRAIKIAPVIKNPAPPGGASFGRWRWGKARLACVVLSGNGCDRGPHRTPKMKILALGHVLGTVIQGLLCAYSRSQVKHWEPPLVFFGGCFENEPGREGG